MMEISRRPARPHLQGARNGRRGEGEHVDLRAHFLQALFVDHPEALFFVDDDEA